MKKESGIPEWLGKSVAGGIPEFVNWREGNPAGTAIEWRNHCFWRDAKKYLLPAFGFGLPAAAVFWGGIGKLLRWW